MQETSLSATRGWEPLTTVKRGHLEQMFGKDGAAKAVNNHVLVVDGKSFLNRRPRQNVKGS